jgi:[ribosomal protein S18]-alanine N-acetyltransferase
LNPESPIVTGPVVASALHAGVFAALHARCFAQAFWPESAFAALLSDATVTGLLACDPSGDPLGFVLVRHVLDEAEILTIGTLDAARRRGVAGRLLKAACAIAAEHGVARIFLEVSADNGPALALYASAGFVPVGRRRDYYGQGSDALVLRRATVLAEQA